MPLIILLMGAVIGISLGLTGGGGAIFAVPMLVYGLGLAAREAVGISLAAVGTTSLVGFLYRWRLGQVEVRTGLLFAAAGMIGAPIGSRIAGMIPESALLLLFACLMALVAARFWQQSSLPILPVKPPDPSCPSVDDLDGPTCRRDADGNLLLNSPCAILLLWVGIATGILSGMFGVGGGFVIVPALVLFSGMSLQRAIGTSLGVITLVSVSGVASHLFQGREIDPLITGLFILGGLGGLYAGQQIGRRLSGPTLQRVFAVAIMAVACFVIFRSVYF
jgi:uncharacterized protein